MKYYKIDDKVFFNQDDLLEELKGRLSPDEQHLSDECILREAYMFEEYDEVEFNLYDCDYEGIVSSWEDGRREQWFHRDTSTTFYMDVNYIRDTDNLRTNFQSK